MEMEKLLVPKQDIKILIDAAKEIQAGGETAHQVVGEISISLERLAKLKDDKSWGKDEVQLFIKRFFKESKEYLLLIYKNQETSRKFYRWTPFYWAGAILIAYLGIRLIQLLLNNPPFA